MTEIILTPFQSLFYWITYSYQRWLNLSQSNWKSFNPYFIGLPILICGGYPS